MPKHRSLPLGVVIEDRPIDFLDQLYSRLTLRKPTITVGEGTKRARKRIAEQRAVQPEPAAVPKPTRQQRRREKLLRERQLVTVAKREISARGLDVPGGSAAIRTPGDVKRMLGQEV